MVVKNYNLYKMADSEQSKAQKRVLIFESDKVLANSMYCRFLSEKFDPSIIIYDPESLIDSTDLDLENNPQDYAIMNCVKQGDRGMWADLAPQAEAYNTLPIIYSGNEYVVQAAKDMGFHAFEKPDGLEKIVELIKNGD